MEMGPDHGLIANHQNGFTEFAQPVPDLLQIEAMPLEQDEYYEHQIAGLAVWTAGGEYLGTVHEVISTGSNDVYLVRGEGREILIPAIEDVVLEINLAQGRLVVELMEGLV